MTKVWQVVYGLEVCISISAAQYFVKVMRIVGCHWDNRKWVGWLIVTCLSRSLTTTYPKILHLQNLEWSVQFIPFLCYLWTSNSLQELTLGHCNSTFSWSSFSCRRSLWRLARRYCSTLPESLPFRVRHSLWTISTLLTHWSLKVCLATMSRYVTHASSY